MTKLLDYCLFILGEAAVAFRRNIAMAFAAVTTGAIALFLLGLLTFSFQAAADYAKTVPNMFDIRVFLVDQTPKSDVQKTIAQVRNMPGVSEVVLIPKENAWARMKSEHPELTQGLDNPLPDQLKVTVQDLKFGDKVANQIQNLPTVVPEDGVHYLRQEQRMAAAFLNAFKILGPALFALLLIAAAILIYNTIRLTVLSRRVEIRIMQLVGASAFAIRVPFLIEGTMQGVGAGVAASALLFTSVRLLGTQLEINALPPSYPVWPAVALLVLTGGGYGFVCSVFAVRVPLQSL